LRQNSIKFQKTNTEQITAFRLSTMLMKINELSSSFHDVYEKKANSSQITPQGGWLGEWGRLEGGSPNRSIYFHAGRHRNPEGDSFEVAVGKGTLFVAAAHGSHRYPFYRP
jgi:hypothetical protein